MVGVEGTVLRLGADGLVLSTGANSRVVGRKGCAESLKRTGVRVGATVGVPPLTTGVSVLRVGVRTAFSRMASRWGDVAAGAAPGLATRGVVRLLVRAATVDPYLRGPYTTGDTLLSL